jgi:hypothetical protein
MAMMKITDALIAEHVAFSGVFDQIERLLPKAQTVDEVKLLGSLVEGLLGGHAETEQDLAYAAVDHVLEDKNQLRRMHQDHQEIDAHLNRVQAATDLVEGQRLLRAAVKASRKHFRSEERTVFPLINQVLRSEMLAELGDAWMQRYSGRQLRGGGEPIESLI